jgi:hypothetical protein
MISRVIASLALLATAICLSILVMINGWGLTPRSWWWIIGAGLCIQVIIHALVDMVKKEGK